MGRGRAKKRGVFTASHSFLSSPSGSTTAPCRSPAPRVAFALALAYLRSPYRSLGCSRKEEPDIHPHFASSLARTASKGMENGRSLGREGIQPVKLVELRPLYKVFLWPVPSGEQCQLGSSNWKEGLVWLRKDRVVVAWIGTIPVVYRKVLGFLPKNDFSMMTGSRNPDQLDQIDGSPAGNSLRQPPQKWS